MKNVFWNYNYSELSILNLQESHVDIVNEQLTVAYVC